MPENKIILKDNKYSQFITSNPKLSKQVVHFLSYKAVGVEYTEAYKNGWSGITYLIDNKGNFLAGLTNQLMEFLKKQEATFIIEDQRKKIVSSTPLNVSQKLQQLNLIPRDYQEEIVALTDKNSRGIVRAATSSGKSLATALMTAKINKPTIIYVIGLDLLKQFHDLFSSLFEEPIGFIGNGTCNIQRINIASIWTIGRALQMDKKSIVSSDEEVEDDEIEITDQSQKDAIVEMLGKTKLHIFDESHVATTDTIKRIYNNIDPEYIYGFSGTPFRDDGSDLLINGILGDQLINISASRLIKNKVVAQPIIKFIAVPHMPMTTSPYQSVYKNYIVENHVRNKLIIDGVKDLLSKKYVPLVLFKQIKHGNTLVEMAQEEGIKCEMLYGNDSLERRTEVKGMLERGEIEAIFASVVFDIGINLPILSALVLAGGGKSSIRTLQRVGRVIRAYPNKQYAAVLDFFDQTKYLREHSKKRYKTYASEEGFKIIKCKEMLK